MQQIVDLDDADFEILLDAAKWFTENPHSGLTIRQVPVLGMHTKWLAGNRRLVLACLNITEQPHADEPDEELEQDDLDPLGLKALPVHVDVILADPADRALVGGLRHLSAPLPEVDALPVHPEMILIVENKESAYLVPDRPRTVVVHSLGNHLNVLDEIGWLDGARHSFDSLLADLATICLNQIHPPTPPCPASASSPPPHHSSAGPSTCSASATASPSRSQQPTPNHTKKPGERPYTRITEGNFGLERIQ